MDFASIADGRATQALKWIIANDECCGNIVRKKQAVGSALIVWSWFLPLMLTIIVLLVYNLPLLINQLDHAMYNKVYNVGLILGANLLIYPIYAIPDAILVGTNNGYKSTVIQTVGVVVSNLLMILSSSLGYGIVGLACVLILITFSNGLFVFIMCKKSVAWFGIKKPSKEQVSSFFNFSFWILGWSFIQKLILH